MQWSETLQLFRKTSTQLSMEESFIKKEMDFRTKSTMATGQFGHITLSISSTIKSQQPNSTNKSVSSW